MKTETKEQTQLASASALAGIELVTDWRRPEDFYSLGDRDWLPCSEAFADDMLEVMPPMDFMNVKPLGCAWAVCEAWKDDRRGQPLHLWFRMSPRPACRIASVLEIKAELNGAALPIKGMLTASPQPFGTGCDGAGPHAPGEIRKLPVVVGNPHLGNMLLCHACFNREIAFRVERNTELAPGCQFDLPEWASLEVYP